MSVRERLGGAPPRSIINPLAWIHVELEEVLGTHHGRSGKAAKEREERSLHGSLVLVNRLPGWLRSRNPATRLEAMRAVSSSQEAFRPPHRRPVYFFFAVFFFDTLWPREAVFAATTWPVFTRWSLMEPGLPLPPGGFGAKISRGFGFAEYHRARRYDTVPKGSPGPRRSGKS